MSDKKSFFEVTEQVARDLPEGYEIIIRIEKNAGVVILEDPFGDEIDFQSNRECMQDEVQDALECAIEHDKEHHDEYFE